MKFFNDQYFLQKLQTIEEAHSMFVTGLEWLPTNDAESQMIRGYTDASVLSISCDNSLKIHHIPKPGTYLLFLWQYGGCKDAIIMLHCS